MVTYGIIGVKVWIFKGEVLKKGAKGEGQEESTEAAEDTKPRRRPARRGQ